MAFVVARIVKHSARKMANRMAKRQEERRRETEQQTDAGPCTIYARMTGTLSPAERAERSAQRARTIGTTLGSVASLVIYVIAIVLCLGELGVDLRPVLASLGVAGVALGFGAQTIVRDFLSGIFIIMEDQYGVGDIVDVGEASGVIEEVTLRLTRVRSLDGTLWHVPNGEIKRAGNRTQYWSRVLLDIPIAYDADVVRASMLIKKTADDAWRESGACEIIDEPEVWGVEDFGADSVAIRLAAKTAPGSQWNVARDLRARIKQAFDENGFEIPFPQRTVWLRQAGGAPASEEERRADLPGRDKETQAPPEQN